jgi:hypothetical protein
MFRFCMRHKQRGVWDPESCDKEEGERKHVRKITSTSGSGGSSSYLMSSTTQAT